MTSPLTADALAKLAEGATIYGPWRALENGIETGDRYGARGFAMWMDHGTPQDRALIVYLVNHVPEILALLGENERLREVERAARRLVSAMQMTGMMSTRTENARRDLDSALAGEAP